jgi:multidrug efflux pump subunit AcrA (membrane-fusion protein)
MKRSAFVVAVALGSAAVGLAAGALLFRRPGGQPTTTSGERRVLYYRDPMNPARTSPVARKDEMGMDYVPVYEGGEGSGGAPQGAGPGAVHVDARMEQSSGVRTEEVHVRKLEKVIRTVGQVTYDERRLHDVNSKVQGWIDTLYVDYTGKAVRRGDPLMAIYSPALFSTQQDYLLALRSRDDLPPGNPARAGADVLLDAARQRLRFFDIPESEIRALEHRGAPAKTLTVYSPADGYVVEKSVVVGAQVTPGMPLFKIADLSSVWVLADVYEYELPWVATGQQASIELPYAPGASLEGRVTYVYPYVAGQTRTVKVRIEVHNPGNRIAFKPEMYATVTIRSPIVREAVAILEQAVLRTGERSVAIVALGGGWFEPRELKLGVTADGWVEVLSGIRAGEQLVTSSQFLIDSESNLRTALSAMAPVGGAPAPAAEHQGHTPAAAEEPEGQAPAAPQQHEGHAPAAAEGHRGPTPAAVEQHPGHVPGADRRAQPPGP